MFKNNKKGFTLIEMLVVIAIIAVLVAIIIPTVSSATVKAAAAADAANLRSLVAEASTDYLAAVEDTSGMIHFHADKADGAEGQFTVHNGPTFKSKFLPKKVVVVKLNTATGLIEATVDGFTVTQLSDTAASGVAPTSTT